VNRLSIVAEEINPKIIELINARFFCEEVDVIKMMERAVMMAVWPKRETCLVGLSQTEEMILARVKMTRGSREGEVVKVSLPLVRLRTHQAIRERLARKLTK